MNYTIGVWEISKRELIKMTQSKELRVGYVNFSPDGKYIALGTNDGKLKIWDLSSLKIISRFENMGYRNTIAFSNDWKIIASGCFGKNIEIKEVKTGKTVAVLKGPYDSYITSIAISLDKNFVASGNQNGLIEIWEISTGKLVRNIQGHKMDVVSLAFSGDGKYIASGSIDNTIRLWETATGKELQKLENCEYVQVEVLSFSPDNKYFAVGNWDRKIMLWDVKYGKILWMIKGHNSK